MASVDFDAIFNRLEKIDNSFSGDLFAATNQKIAVENVLPLVKQAQVMSQKYSVTCTNPPYMAVGNAGAKINDYVKKNFPDSKADLFAVFIERCGQMTKKNGYQAMITQHSWMFLASFEKLRAKLLAVDIVNMAHLGARAFEEIGGEVVQTTSFVIRKSHIVDYKGKYCRLIDPTSQQGKEDMFLAGENRYAADQTSFSKIPGAPIAYWVNRTFVDAINSSDILEKVAYSFQGMITGDNNYFLRLWHEVSVVRMKTNIKSSDKGKFDNIWVPYNKGGSFRRWYGNNEYLLRWISQGRTLTRARTENIDFYFREGVTWSFVTSGTFSARYFSEGALWDVSGSSIFSINKLCIEYICALMNSKVAQLFFDITNPTINYQVMNVISLPYLKNDKEEIISDISNNCIDVSKNEWDSYETSWDFKRNQLLAKGKLTDAYTAWKADCESRFLQLKANEEELNRIFIDIYGLQEELTPEVADKDVTVHRVFDTKEDVPESMKGSNYVRTMHDEIVSLVSYAVGCMFGRYSLDAEGLAYAGGEWNAGKYQTFRPDEDNCIPITDEEYFQDDIVGRFVEFIRTVYGSDMLEENLDFIAKALGNKGNTNREIIRNYFLNDFIKDHIKTYQKRPIYWMFDSGKQNGFKALVYMHRWNADTTGNVRVEYLHRIQRVYESEINRMQDTIDNSSAAREISAAQKRKDKLSKQLKESKDYDAKIAHLALSRIAIDLDDGVKVNYEKVQTGQDGKKIQILTKI